MDVSVCQACLVRCVSGSFRKGIRWDGSDGMAGIDWDGMHLPNLPLI